MTQKCTVAIHQPNFLPWLGYFEKIAKSDIFVFLDDVQLPKKGGSWVNRNLINIANRKVWATIPIQRGHKKFQLVKDVSIEIRKPWREDYLNKISEAYTKHERFLEYFNYLETILSKDWKQIYELNIELIYGLVDILGIQKPQFVLSSSLNLEGKKTQRIINIIQSVGGTKYLSGTGSQSYLEQNLFMKENIDLQYTCAASVQYNQKNAQNFLSGLSIIDVIMNCELEEIKKYVL